MVTSLTVRPFTTGGFGTPLKRVNQFVKRRILEVIVNLGKNLAVLRRSGWKSLMQEVSLCIGDER
jgi:hypothetical protein